MRAMASAEARETTMLMAEVNCSGFCGDVLVTLSISSRGGMKMTHSSQQLHTIALDAVQTP